MVINVLRGAKTEKIREAGLDRLSTYGIMADTDVRRMRLIIDALIDRGYLTVTGEEYPVVCLAPLYREVIAGDKPLTMMLPRENAPEPSVRGPAAPEPAAHGPVHAAARGVNPRPLSTASAAGPKPEAARPKTILIKAASNEGREPEDDLFIRLKELRNRLAQEARVPAYIIFSDASLRDMCRKRPTTADQFLAVSGVGTAKMEKYGEAFTRLIREVSG
jgi:ATP-dependent DNA helicase RecQ